MVTYIYFVKCPGCEDEHFDFFEDAKACAMGCISQKPIITQVEVDRNDFGECVDHCDLGTVWSWEDVMGKETEAEPTVSIFTKEDFKDFEDDYNPDNDPEFYDNDDISIINEDLLDTRRISFKNNEERQEFFSLCSEIGIFTGKDLDTFMKNQGATDASLLDKLRDYRAELGDDFKVADSEKPQRKPIPEGMTIEQLVEEMEENEDTVECTTSGGLFEKAKCHHNSEGFGWSCPTCDPVESLTEDAYDKVSIEDAVKDSISHLINDLGKDPWADDFADDVIADIENNYEVEVPEDVLKYKEWCGVVASEVSRQVNNSLDEDLEWHTYRITYTTAANPDKEQTTTFKTWKFDVEYAWRMSRENVPHSTIKRIELLEDLSEPEEVHDLGNEYDGGYPKEDLPEIDEVSDAHLIACPECGVTAFDTETGICVNCGFN